MKPIRRLVTVDICAFDRDEDFIFACESGLAATLYSYQLKKLRGMLAMASWVSIMLIDSPSRVRIIPEPTTSNDFETIFAMRPPGISQLKGDQKTIEILGWIKDRMLDLCQARSWDPSVFQEAYSACLDAPLSFSRSSRSVISPNKLFTGKMVFSIKTDGYRTIELISTRRKDKLVIASTVFTDLNMFDVGFARDLEKGLKWESDHKFVAGLLPHFTYDLDLSGGTGQIGISPVAPLLEF
ncbi:hypothetical protein EH165_14820 [Nakamurella antarctica]|uniref:Uncharacterized protein n=1 Tax=Nakamurella antarctica TaxID=1902245 RepID=A0A3G8ZPM5_9ACTN|nr:hypothetical protein [Nakamurella antarctica]AZI59223.1 hypothetical protein EH165_14820 [Nakamurella antarctica]